MESTRTGEEVGRYTSEHNGFYKIGEPPAYDQRTRDADYSAQMRSINRMEWRRSNNVKMNFTRRGFRKTRIPPDLLASMEAYYHNNKMQRVREEWAGKGAYVNWWKADAMMIYTSDSACNPA